jgi:hypothetical protein
MLDYSLFYILLENLSLIWRCQHYQFRVAKFRPMLRAFEQVEIFFVPYLP